MGLLDELRQETEAAKAREETDKQRHERLVDIYDTEVNPKIEMLYTFLKELEEHLNYLKPEIFVGYDIPGYGRLENMKQGKYAMEKGRREILKKVPFKFTCSEFGPLTYEVEGKEKLSHVMDELQQAGIRYSCKKNRGGNDEVVGAIMEIEPSIPVSIVFEGVLETSGITMTITNFEDIMWTTTYLKPEFITDNFLDELGKYIMRKESNFLRQDLSEDNKGHIREMVDEANRQREQEIRLAEEREYEEMLKQKQNSLIERIKKVKNPFAKN